MSIVELVCMCVRVYVCVRAYVYKHTRSTLTDAVKLDFPLDIKTFF